jgi:hypothetical protein
MSEVRLPGHDIGTSEVPNEEKSRAAKRSVWIDVKPQERHFVYSPSG